MRTDIVSFVMETALRRKIAAALLEYPKRQWSCAAVEEVTGISHATVFRALSGLAALGLLKSFRMNRKDVIYELAKGPLADELRRILSLEKRVSESIAREFIGKIKKKGIVACILYGSSVRGDMKSGSDVDILIVVGKREDVQEKELHDAASCYSSQVNKTIALGIMDLKEIKTEKDGLFLRSVKEAMEVLYGKAPF